MTCELGKFMRQLATDPQGFQISSEMIIVSDNAKSTIKPVLLPKPQMRQPRRNSLPHTPTPPTTNIARPKHIKNTGRTRSFDHAMVSGSQSRWESLVSTTNKSKNQSLTMPKRTTFLSPQSHKGKVVRRRANMLPPTLRALPY